MPNRSSILRPFAFLPLALPLAMLLSGCALTDSSLMTPIAAAKGASLRGHVHGGQQPIVGAHVYLFAADTGAYGNASDSLLSAGSTGLSDGVGAYVTTDASGSWSITGDYTCNPGQQLYIYTLGGNPGAGVNSAAGLMAALGDCANINSSTYIWVNEVSTVAAAYAMSGFAVDATHVASSGSALATVGMANAFAAAANLVDLPTGSALATTPGGQGAVPASTINMLANVLATCINSSGPSDPNCVGLLSDATSDGTISGVAPTDTATAMINIAHNPGANVGDLFNLPTGIVPFQPSISQQPNDFTLAVAYTGNSIDIPAGISVDASGNVWIANIMPYQNSTVTILSSLGVPLTNSPLSGNGLNAPVEVSIDQLGNAWVANSGAYSISEFDASGNALASVSNGTLNAPSAIGVDPSGNIWATSPGNSELSLLTTPSSPSLSTITGDGLNSPISVAFDFNGNAWVANAGSSSVSLFDPSGTPLINSPITGNSINTPNAISIDNFGNGWISNVSNSISVVNVSGTPAAGSPFTGGGLNSPGVIAFDGAGNAWVSNQAGPGVTALTSAGNVLTGSPLAQGTFNDSEFVAVDGSGNLWVANEGGNTVFEIVGAAVPAVTPMSVATTNGTVGTRP